MKEAIVIYGFNLGDSRAQINRRWLSENYPNIQMYTTYKLKETKDIMYGIPCKLNSYTGEVNIEFGYCRSNLYDLYSKYRLYLDKNDYADDGVFIGYYVAYKCDKKDYEEFDIEIEPEQKPIINKFKKENKHPEYSTEKQFAMPIIFINDELS